MPHAHRRSMTHRSFYTTLRLALLAALLLLAAFAIAQPLVADGLDRATRWAAAQSMPSP